MQCLLLARHVLVCSNYRQHWRYPAKLDHDRRVKKRQVSDVGAGSTATLMFILVCVCLVCCGVLVDVCMCFHGWPWLVCVSTRHGLCVVFLVVALDTLSYRAMDTAR